MTLPSRAALAGPSLRLHRRPLAVRAAAVALGTVFLALSSWIEVPMIPVPMTMQTFAVTLVGALYGGRLGLVTVLAWLAEAVVGLPVLAGGASGVAHFVGPTGGYLLSFPLVAWLLGAAADRGWFSGQSWRGFALMLAGNALILAIGAAWLATQIGGAHAIAYGVTPFLFGGALKAALAAAIAEATGRLARRGAPPA